MPSSGLPFGGTPDGSATQPVQRANEWPAGLYAKALQFGPGSLAEIGAGMNRIRVLRAIAAGAAVVALAAAGGAAYAATSSRSVIVKGPDHQRLSFVVAPGRSFVFKLPAANDPIRVDIASPSTNGGVQTPSEVFSALINVDANRAGMSWIGMNSDGSQSGNSTIHSKDIANLVCGSNCVIAWLRVKSVSARTVVLTANAQTSIIRERYIVNIWY
jgi:hypothetical protein